ncbi:MAG: 5'-nucleotidase C-terminal domain-containing protein, partial [Oscillospiraceae bacterium]|nr:5'-nucleotidase C-terminal domain-containing protein [Oscillospiraceae bacterium]
ALLWDWLEYSVSFAVLGEDEKIDQESSEFDGFLQISGFWFRYDLSAQPGDRVLYVELDDGTVLERGDETMFFTVCATEYMLSGGYGFQAVESIGLEQGLADALAEYMQETVITQPDGSRIRTIGSNDDPLISRTTVFVVALAACIIAICGGKIKNRSKVENQM